MTYRFRTRAIRAGFKRTPEGEHCEPIFTTSSFVFNSAEQAAARFSGEEPGNLYSRFTNPTNRVFEERLASLEGGQWCVATASGMSAITSTCMGLLKAGDHIVASKSLFGSTIILLRDIIGRFGIELTLVSLTEQQAWQTAIQDNTKMFFLESPSNPTMEVADIAALAALAKAHECALVVDNVYCSPALQNPLELGADIVVHSATKYLDGHGRVIGGAIIGNDEALREPIYGFLRTAGPSMSPFNAWIFLHGLETLDLRMQAHCDNAHHLAHWLQTQPQVKKVIYPGLETHPQHALAKKQQRRFGGIVAFELNGGQQEAWAFINATQFISITANLGDAKSTLTHPASTTHGRLSIEEKQQAGIAPGLLRISVGLEDVEDIKQDLLLGLKSSKNLSLESDRMPLSKINLMG